MQLTKKQVQNIAKLSRLSLSNEEIEFYQKDLSRVFAYVEILQEVDISRVEETCQVTGLEHVVREDKVIECSEETKKKLIDSFPKKMGKLLQVKGVFIDRVDDSFL